MKIPSIIGYHLLRKSKYEFHEVSDNKYSHYVELYEPALNISFTARRRDWEQIEKEKQLREKYINKSSDELDF
ncbi:hypothetical protein IW492_05800 [Enterococcus sp. BWB1-3]|uniref:hypothetical protein n=1 Tax=Enterococcus sp. BWB1-3 TaxID=2787713 RepID=UPI001923489B|nr:hypothetical protein [Enterococcus sp. BWB1-3]MBL1228745.1 hypothetical protein [Enterococcus sp. BWB1-3]